MTIKFKRLNPDAVVPSYAHFGDAGMDLKSTENYILRPGERRAFALGFALELPKNYVALIWDKGGMAVRNGVHSMAGVCDAGYRGEYFATLINLGKSSYKIEKGDKIAQLLIQPIINVKIKEVKILSNSQRGQGRLGSTGRK